MCLGGFHPDSGYDPAWAERGLAIAAQVQAAAGPLALLFRDWFRAHPEAVPGYARFKRDLARETGDIGPYTDVKDSVVDMIVAIAESWAAGTGWAPHAQPARQ